MFASNLNYIAIDYKYVFLTYFLFLLAVIVTIEVNSYKWLLLVLTYTNIIIAAMENLLLIQKISS